MSNQESAATTDLLEQFRAASDGLYFISETDAPFEVVYLPDVQDESMLPDALAQQPGIPAADSAEVVDLPYFFRNMTREDDAGEEENGFARRFKELQELLEQRLQDVKVYRLGKRRIQAYILGKTASGDYAGLKTLLVET